MSASPQPTPSGSDLGAIIGQSFNLYFTRLAQYIIVPLFVLLPAYIINGIIEQLAWRAALGAALYGGLGAAIGGSFLVSFLTGLIQWTAYGLAIGLVAKMVEAHLGGKTLSLGEAFKAVPVGPLALVSLLFGVATSIGWFIIIIGGLAAWFFFCLAFPATALDHESPIDALTRAVKGALKVPAELIVVLVIFLAYFFITGAIAGVFIFTGLRIVVQILSGAFAVFVIPWFGAALTLCYNKAKQLGA